MRHPLLVTVAATMGVALAAAPACAQLRLAPPTLSLPPVPPVAGAPAPLRFRAPWELRASQRRESLLTSDSLRTRGPAAPGACRMPVFAVPGDEPRDEMPVFRPDTASPPPPMRVATPRVCAAAA